MPEPEPPSPPRPLVRERIWLCALAGLGGVTPTIAKLAGFYVANPNECPPASPRRFSAGPGWLSP